MIEVTVSYALPEKQVEIAMQMEVGVSVADVIVRSGVLTQFPNLQLDKVKVGVFGKCVTLETIVKNHDRVEIYRELQKDPKELRRTKVVRKKR